MGNSDLKFTPSLQGSRDAELIILYFVTVLVTRYWNMLRLATGSITAFMSRLEKAGYVRRETHMNQVLTSTKRAESKEGLNSMRLGRPHDPRGRYRLHEVMLVILIARCILR